MNEIKKSLGLSRGWKLGLLLLAVLGSGSLTSLWATNPYPLSQYLYRQYNDGTNAMNYRLLVPPSYDANSGTNYPLVFFVHGVGETESSFVAGDPTQYNSKQMTDNGQYVFASNQATFPCFFVLVQTKMGAGTAYDAISGLITQLAQQYHIDQDRVIVTGLSAGGYTVYQMIQYHHTQLAATVPICPSLPWDFSLPPGAASVPAWFFHAYDDNTVGTTCYGTMITLQKFRLAGGRPIFTQYGSGGHGIWTYAYNTPPLIPWVAAQRRGQPMQSSPATVSIVTPTSAGTYSSPNSSVSLAGTTTQLSGVFAPSLTGVRYAKGGFATDGGAPVAGGTTASWSTPSIALNAAGTNTTIDVVALGTTWASNLGGNTYYSSTLNATYTPGGGDTVAPTATITTPTSATTFATTSSSLNLGGTAADNVGVTQVTWSNDRGGSGTASGTTSWTANGIILQNGQNVITVTAKDAALLTGTDTLTVTYTPPGDTTIPTVAVTAPTSGSTVTTTTVAFSGTAGDNVGLQSVICKNLSKGNELTTVPVSGTANVPWNATVSLAPGLNTIEVTSKDTSNNVSTVVTRTVTSNPPASSWTSADIGNVGVAGSFSQSGGTFTVTGAGNDFASPNDAFRFVYLPATGDCSIIARVATQQFTTPLWNAKAGVMIRESLNAASRYAFMGLTPGYGGSVHIHYSSTDTWTGNNSFSGVNAPQWVKVTRVANVFTMFYSANGTTWTTAATDTVSMGSAVFVGLLVNSNSTTISNTSTFDNVSTTGTASVWSNQDIGTTGVAGSFTSPGSGQLTVSGAGAQLSGTSDAFHYVYQTVTGDCTIIAKVNSYTSTANYARSGLMIREVVPGNSRFAFMGVMPYGYHYISHYNATDGWNGATQSIAHVFPCWLKLVRVGNNFTAFYSTDGINWGTPVCSNDSISMVSTVKIGVAVNSNNTTSTNTTVFSNVSISTP
jgi:poly(3-hydroxybutyrate) depolymerase